MLLIFASLQSGSQAHTNATVHNLRGDSPPSRNSVHSSGSSSLGSLERLDESGYASQINIAEMALNGVPVSLKLDFSNKFVIKIIVRTF